MTPRRIALIVGLALVAGLAAFVWRSQADRQQPASVPHDAPVAAEPIRQAPQPATEPPAAAAAPRAPEPAPSPPPAPPSPPATPEGRAAEGERITERLETDETRLMTKIRSVVKTKPEQAIVLIDAADRAHPEGPLAEERAALKVDALVHAGRIGPARDAAEQYLRRYPSGPHARHVETLTGVHPRPLGPE